MAGALAVAAVIALGAVIVLGGGAGRARSAGGGTKSASFPVGPAVPRLQAKGWLNSAPLAPADLAGKVVLYDFWTYSCVNCVRTLPYIRSWYDRYRQDGLVVVGIHSPEFDFEKDHANVARAVQNLGVTWPVALDDDMTIWAAFANHFWPADYVADGSGRLRHTHLGEGDYQATEDALRHLLGVAPGAPRAAPPTPPAGQSASTANAAAAPSITNETYLGTAQGSAGARAGLATYPQQSGAVPIGEARLVGGWQASPQEVQSSAPNSAIELGYEAREVNLVMATAAPAGAPIDVVVELDGQPLVPAYRTAQTMVDGQGRTFVRVQASDLYRLVLGPGIEDHRLRLTPQTPGLEAFAFTFGP